MTNEPKDQARDLLAHYFTLQRVVLPSGYPQEMAQCGWTLEHQQTLSRLLGYGCHNLAEIIENNDAGQLRHEAEWLYEHAEAVCYPSCWQSVGRHSTTWSAWSRFWTTVAEILDREPRFGQAWEKAESLQEAHFRLVHELYERGLVDSPPRWARLLGVTGHLVKGSFARTPAGRDLAQRPAQPA